MGDAETGTALCVCGFPQLFAYREEVAVVDEGSRRVEAGMRPAGSSEDTVLLRAGFYLVQCLQEREGANRKR